MGLGPDRAPVVYPTFGWLEIADALDAVGDGALAQAIRVAMDGQRLGDDAPFDLTDDERARVVVVIADKLGAS